MQEVWHAKSHILMSLAAMTCHVVQPLRDPFFAIRSITSTAPNANQIAMFVADIFTDDRLVRCVGDQSLRYELTRNWPIFERFLSARV